MSKDDTPKVIEIRSRPDGQWVEVLSDGRERPYAPPEPDWAALDAMTDEEITARAMADPDSLPMTDAEFERASRGARVARLRKRLGLSQSAFASRYRIPLATLQDWEQGRRLPDSATTAYLDLIAKDPEMIARLLAEPA